MRRTYLLALLIWLGMTTALIIYVAGGRPPRGHDLAVYDPRGVFDQNELYDPGTNSWRSLPPLPLAVHGLTGAAYPHGWIHIPGGATRRGVSGANVTLAHQVFRADQTCGPAGG